MSELQKSCEKAAATVTHFIEKKKIPPEVLAAAKGLVIYSALKGGAMWISGSAGSGVVVARLDDGTWSPPSGIGVGSGGVGMVYGIDYCVVVLNTQAAVDAYKKSDVSLDGKAEAAAGPMGGKVDSGPTRTYTRTRGAYIGLSLDGTVVREQKKANAAFYGSAVTAAEILENRVTGTKWQTGARMLMDVLGSIS